MQVNRRAITIILLKASVVLRSIGAARAQEAAPVVSPDLVEDVPSTRVDPFPGFDNFAWRAFIALNWASPTDPAHRGVPDRAKTLDERRPSDIYEGQSTALQTETRQLPCPMCQIHRDRASARSRLGKKAMVEIFDSLGSILNGLPLKEGRRRQESPSSPGNMRSGT
jgi:hypothetical protein